MTRSRLCPDDIRFTQDSVGSRFRDGRYLSRTFEEILYGRLTPDTIEAIEVVKENGVWLALTGNRRLYIYRKLEELDVISTVPVVIREIDDWSVRSTLSERRTTTCHGYFALCRQPEADEIMKETIAKWRQSRGIDPPTSLYSPSTALPPPVPQPSSYPTSSIINMVPSNTASPSDQDESDTPTTSLTNLVSSSPQTSIHRGYYYSTHAKKNESCCCLGLGILAGLIVLAFISFIAWMLVQHWKTT